jgi:predicted RNase H-like HicB family nuclease
MAEVNDTIHVSVEYFSGEDEGDEGVPYYVAACEEIALVTDGETFEELLANLREAIDLHLKNTDTVTQFNLVPNPRIEIRLLLPENYAKTA